MPRCSIAVEAGSRTLVKETNMRKTATLIAIVALVACATPGERTAIGAGGGAAVGAGVGALAGGWKGAIIGAAAGGLVGGAVGNVLDKQAQELKEVAENTKRTEDGILVDLKSKLLFTSDSAVLKPEAVEQVAKLGEILGKYPQDRIRVQGHTDSTGSAAHNEELSLRRAQAVRDVLVSRGVNGGQVLVEGAGASRPIADNKTAAGRAANRRVELHIDVPGTATDDVGRGTDAQASR
jgi:outer membrane protein OmpA-like peptidoglycan-associated protein